LEDFIENLYTVEKQYFGVKEIYEQIKMFELCLIFFIGIF